MTAVNGHIQDVSLEQGKFDREIAEMKASRVAQPLQQAEAIEREVSSAQAEIERLTALIANRAPAATTFRTQAQTAEQELAVLATQFGSSLSQVVRNLNDHRDSIISALK
jgi:hypothetical protein